MDVSGAVNRDKPYVVGIDDSVAALHAARWAADQAAVDHAPIRLVHAYRDTATAGAGTELLQRARAAVLDVRPDAVVELCALRGDAADVLVEQSRSARLIVLGTHRMHGYGVLRPGMRSVRVMNRAACPVVIARGRRDDEPAPSAGPVVVGVDGAPHSQEALAFAFEQAAGCAARLVALHAWQPGAEVDPEQARDRLDRWLAPWLDKYPDVAVTKRVVCDQVVRALLHFAASARLLVIGNRGPDAYRSMVLGGTGQHLIHHAAGPIAVVRADNQT